MKCPDKVPLESAVCDISVFQAKRQTAGNQRLVGRLYAGGVRVVLTPTRSPSVATGEERDGGGQREEQRGGEMQAGSVTADTHHLLF